MEGTHHDAVRLAVSREFGIGIDDPAKLREFVSAKWDSMDLAERTAFEMQLGRATTELKAGGPPRRISYALVLLTFVTLSWFIWRPLAPTMLVLAIAGLLRRFSMRHAPFWAPAAAVVFGASYGLVIAGLIVLASVWAFQSTVAHILLGGFGLYASTYIGYSVGGMASLATGDDKRAVAQKIAVATYLLVVVLAYAARLFGLAV